MSAAPWELQKAIVAALRADAALATAMGGTAVVLDFVPENQPMPYVEFEEEEAREDDTGRDADGAMTYGTVHLIRLFSWSAYEGRKQAKEMNDAVAKRLRDAEGSLAITGHRLINMRVRYSYVLRDRDLQAYYGIVSIRAVTEEI